MTFLLLNGKMIFYPSVHWYMYCYYYILWKSKILVQFIAVNTHYMSACEIIMCLYILFIYIVYVESVLTWWVCCLSDGGPGGAGGGSEDGAGDHQLVPRRLTPPQPPPRLLPALPEGAVQLLQNTPHVPGHSTEYRHCKRERECHLFIR